MWMVSDWLQKANNVPGTLSFLQQQMLRSRYFYTALNSSLKYFHYNVPGTLSFLEQQMPPSRYFYTALNSSLKYFHFYRQCLDVVDSIMYVCATGNRA